ncbi:MAG: hypothetical protein ABI785_07185 [Gemmatimonadales bacterium]
MIPLAVSRALLEAFRAEGVRYCHWKSSEHVLAGLAGETDLDILIDRAQAGLAQEILARTGFKRFAATIGMGYPAIEDYIALDRATGTLLHCHTHYRLVAGERHLKGLRLPWENQFLESRVWDPEHQLFLVDPNLELLTLLVRAAVKLRVSDLALQAFGRRYIRGGLVAEYEWLSSRIERATVLELGSQLLGAQVERPLAELIDGPLTTSALLRFRRAARGELDRFRYYGRATAFALQTLRGVAWTIAGVNRRLLRSPRPLRRTIPSGGLVVAFLGSDGSGKSTLVGEVSRTYASKIDVYRVYFGSGDGPASLLRLPLRLARRLYVRLLRGPRQGPRVASGPASARPVKKGAAGLGRLLWGLSLAREKGRRLQSAWRARSLGMLVLADRFPQTQVLGFNDGPLLSDLRQSPGRIARWVASREARAYEWANRYPPDLVIRLNVSPAVAVARKPEMTVEEVARRVQAVRSMTFGAGAKVVDVDADRPLEEVLREVKWIVWSAI